MAEDSEEKQETKEEPKEEPKEKQPEIMLDQVPTEFGLVFKTPAGQLYPNSYLAYLGNLLLEIKKVLVG